MEERRKFKNKENEYRTINNIIKKKIREAKEQEVKEKCIEIKALQIKHDSFNEHKKVKEISRENSKKVNKLVNNDGKIIIALAEMKSTLTSYIKQVFYDIRPEPPQFDNATGPEIITEKVKSAISAMKDGKAHSLDNVQIEFLKLLDDDSIKYGIQPYVYLSLIHI